MAFEEILPIIKKKHLHNVRKTYKVVIKQQKNLGKC